MNWHLFVLKVGYFAAVVNCAVIQDQVVEQGLYSSLDHVTILTNKNFEGKVYGQPHALLVQFYNSYCGHCRAFAPKFKSMASEVAIWKNIVKLAAIDCSVEENNEICREFEVMAYPSLRYLHENYKKGNGNIGDRFSSSDSAESLKMGLIKKLQNEQTSGRLSMSPLLNIASYATIEAALRGIPSKTMYTFLVFENDNSTLGSELALDMNDYNQIIVKRVFNDNELAKSMNVNEFDVTVINSNLEYTKLNIPDLKPTKSIILKAISDFLKSKFYNFPVRDKNIDSNGNIATDDQSYNSLDTDVIYYNDLVKAIRTTLHTEITRYKILSGEPLTALYDYLDILVRAFPFKDINFKEYLTHLRDNLKLKNQWSGNEIYEMVKNLGLTYTPLYSSDLDYIGCKGSESKYRGFTCGLWTLFHTLTVNAYQKDDNLGPVVLRTMFNYVKYFFGCTKCSEHFQAMAAKNKLFNVQGNDKAILWLWIAHNEVNLRLAGDTTEDPKHPKIQFPSIKRCPECRLKGGAWNLPAVFQYLVNIYDGKNIEIAKKARPQDPVSSPFSNLDLGLLSLLYILSFLMLIFVIKYFISNHFLRKRRFKHAWAKVQA